MFRTSADSRTNYGEHVISVGQLILFVSAATLIGFAISVVVEYWRHNEHERSIIVTAVIAFLIALGVLFAAVYSVAAN